jgi:Transposase DDE domain
VAQNDAITATDKRRRSALDRRTTRHEGYGMSQSRRAMTECIFGWGKQHGTMRKTKHRGLAAVAADFLLNLIAYNLIRIPKLVAADAAHHPSPATHLGSQSPSLIGPNDGSISWFSANC